MTPRWRAFLFIAVAAILQLAFAETRLDAREQLDAPRLETLGETALTDGTPTLAAAREIGTTQRGSRLETAGDDPAGALPPTHRAVEPGIARRTAPTSGGIARAGTAAPREIVQTGPPRAA